jgi:hypothetical protein
MGSRSELQEILEETLGSDQVYFQPPSSIEMQYPSIVYSRDTGSTKFAGDTPYVYDIRYQVIVIGKNPASDILDKVAMLPKCVFVRHYTVANLHHDVYNLYY